MKKFFRGMIVMAMIIAATLTSAISVHAASNISFSNLNANDITSNSARVDFTTVNPSRKCITQAGIEIKASTARDWTVKTDNVGNAYRYYSSLNSWYIIGAGKEVNMALTPGTTYQYRAFCVAGGAKYYSATKTFVTKGSSSASKSATTTKTQNLTFKSLLASNITSTSARIDFSTINPSRLSITGIGMQIRKKGSGTWTTKTDNVPTNWRAQTSIPSWYLIGRGQEVNFDLVANTTYEYRAFCNAGGKTHYSGIATFTTSKESQREIMGNGICGIIIDINAAPYSTKSHYIQGVGQIEYTKVGCTWFVASRVQQLTGKDITVHGPENWLDYANYYGFQTGFDLRGRSIAVYNNHVMIIEKVEGNYVYISEGGCWGYGCTARNGYCRIAKVDKNYIYGEAVRNNGAFKGFVYF